MAEVKKAVTVLPDPWESPRETWQHVTMPEEDPTGLAFPTITLNKIEFKTGQTYLVPKQVAAFVLDRIKVYNRSVTRLFSPVVDRQALQQVSVGTTSPVAPSGDRPGFVDASQVHTF